MSSSQDTTDDSNENGSLELSPRGIFLQHDHNENLKSTGHERGTNLSGDDRATTAGEHSGMSVQDVKETEKAVTGAAKVNFITDFRRKCQDDAVYLGNLKHSLCLAMALFALGIVVAQFGPSFLDLQIITGTDVGQASAFFTTLSIGNLLGSIASGSLTGRKINASLGMLLSLLAMGGAVIGIPYCSPFAAMIAVLGLTGLFAGFIGTTASAEHMRIWGKDGPVLMQLLHFCFAVGGVISPLITEPFLAARVDNETSAFYNLTKSYHQDSFTESDYRDNNSLEIPSHVSVGERMGRNILFRGNSSLQSDTVVVTDERSQRTNVHWAFLISGLIAIVISTLFFFLYTKSRKMVKKAKGIPGDQGEEQQASGTVSKSLYRNIPKSLYISLVAGLCIVLGLYCCVESTFASFLMTFVVRRFRSVSKSEGAHITAVYWASFAASRFLMIFVSRALSPVRVLYVGGSLMVVAFTGFTLSSGPWAGGGSSSGDGEPTLSSDTNLSAGLNTVMNISGAGLDPGSVIRDLGDGGSVPALTFFTALAALAMSGMFPAGLSWGGAELVEVTGRVSSLVFVAASLGAMLNPLLVSRLMQHVSNLWFCYVLLLEVAALAVVFFSLLALNRCVVNRRYGELHGGVGGGNSRPAGGAGGAGIEDGGGAGDDDVTSAMLKT